MRRTIALALCLLVTTGTAQAATMLPWSTVTDLEENVAQAFVAVGCEDARPIRVFLVMDGVDPYYLVVTAAGRWAIFGPAGADGKVPIWYGTIAGEDRLVIEHALVGTRETDVCAFLTKQSA